MGRKERVREEREGRASRTAGRVELARRGGEAYARWTRMARPCRSTRPCGSRCGACSPLRRRRTTSERGTVPRPRGLELGRRSRRSARGDRCARTRRGRAERVNEEIEDEGSASAAAQPRRIGMSPIWRLSRSPGVRGCPTARRGWWRRSGRRTRGRQEEARPRPHELLSGEAGATSCCTLYSAPRSRPAQPLLADSTPSVASSSANRVAHPSGLATTTCATVDTVVKGLRTFKAGPGQGGGAV